MKGLRRVMVVLTACLLGAGAANAQAQETVIYYHTDAIGSVRMITDENGQVVARYDYLPFGEPWPGLPPNPDVRQYAGKDRDAETGFNYFGARYYASGTGRFTTVDPLLEVEKALVDPQQWNRYAYVRNNPFRFVDPDGRALETPWDAFNFGLGIASLTANVTVGNLGGAIVDALGIVYDAGATVVPGLPGGAGTFIKTLRVADQVGDVGEGGRTAVAVVQRAMSRAELKATQARVGKDSGSKGYDGSPCWKSVAVDPNNTGVQNARRRNSAHGHRRNTGSHKESGRIWEPHRMKVSISITDPWEFGEGREWRPLQGELVKSVVDDHGGLALIRLDEPLVHGGTTWHYVIAWPRKQGEVMSTVEKGREVFSSIIGLPSAKAEGPDPFASARETWNELAIVGTVIPERSA